MVAGTETLQACQASHHRCHQRGYETGQRPAVQHTKCTHCVNKLSAHTHTRDTHLLQLFTSLTELIFIPPRRHRAHATAHETHKATGYTTRLHYIVAVVQRPPVRTPPAQNHNSSVVLDHTTQIRSRLLLLATSSSPAAHSALRAQPHVL